MAPLSKCTSTAFQTCARQRLPAVAYPSTVALQRRRKADARATFEGPYEYADKHDPNQIPDFSKYMSKKPETRNRLFQYFMAGTMGAITAMGAKATVNGMSTPQNAARGVIDSLTRALMHVGRLPGQYVRLRRRTRSGQGRNRPGANTRRQECTPSPSYSSFLLLIRSHKVIIKWRGKPVFIRHRTPDEIKEAEDADWQKLRDPQPDSDRVKKPEWLVMLGKL